MYHLLNHRVFSVTGDKAAGLLHGQLSNSISDLKVVDANYNLLLTQKGKVVADLHVVHAEAQFLCIVAPEFYDIVKNQIAKLAPLSRCAVVDTEFVVVHSFGEEAPSCHPERSEGSPKSRGGSFATAQDDRRSFTCFRTNRYGEPGFDILAKRDELTEILSALPDPALTPEQIELVRIKNGIAAVGRDVTEKNLPQEGALGHALHFNKGCYLGQEVIARLHYRGHVNKILIKLVGEGPEFKAGDVISSHDKECGEITSVAFDAAANKAYMLGYVPYDLKSETKWIVSNRCVLSGN